MLEFGVFILFLFFFVVFDIKELRIKKGRNYCLLYLVTLFIISIKCIIIYVGKYIRGFGFFGRVANEFREFWMVFWENDYLE